LPKKPLSVKNKLPRFIKNEFKTQYPTFRQRR
jgi:hypothetical protein